MKIILGIGNPGTKYDETRHNIGFTAVDTLAEQSKADFREKTKFSALIAEATFLEKNVYSSSRKPTTTTPAYPPEPSWIFTNSPPTTC